MSPISIPGKVRLGSVFTAWTPAEITTALWLDAADASTITESGGAVSQWDDKSGNGRHVLQATENKKPTYNLTGLNNKPAIDWGSGINARSLNNTSTYNPVRIYGVAHYEGPDPFNDYYGLCSFNYTQNLDLLITHTSGAVWFGSYPVFLNGSNSSSSVALPTISNPFIFGTDASPSSARTSTFIGSDRGANVFPTRGWRGKIAEIIILPAAPSTYERNKIEGYLAHKWGLTANLPSDHPYKLVGPTP